jgi:hypothetical protein
MREDLGVSDSGAFRTRFLRSANVLCQIQSCQFDEAVCVAAIPSRSSFAQDGTALKDACGAAKSGAPKRRVLDRGAGLREFAGEENNGA